MTDHTITRHPLKTALLLLVAFSLTTLGLTGCPPYNFPIHKDFWTIGVTPIPTGCDDYYVDVNVRRPGIAVSYEYMDDQGYSTSGVAISDGSGKILVPVEAWRVCPSPTPTPTPNEILSVWVEEWGGEYGVNSAYFWTGTHLADGGSGA